MNLFFIYNNFLLILSIRNVLLMVTRKAKSMRFARLSPCWIQVNELILFNVLLLSRQVHDIIALITVLTLLEHALFQLTYFVECTMDHLCNLEIIDLISRIAHSEFVEGRSKGMALHYSFSSLFF